MLLHYTKKIAAKLTGVSPTPLAEVSPLGSWHGHVLSLDRRQCVLFCHDSPELKPRTTSTALFASDEASIHETEITLA